MRRPSGDQRGDDGVEVAVGELERIRPVGRHQPELVPLAPEVGAVDHPPAVAAPVGPRLPGGLLVADLPRRRAPARASHAPESARAPDVAAVGDQDQLAAVRRPRRREVLIHRVVVVPRAGRCPGPR